MLRWLYLPLLGFLLVGCATRKPIFYRPLPQPRLKPAPAPILTPKPAPTTKSPIIQPENPTRIYELQEVQDNNFNPDYMYPDTPKRSPKTAHSNTSVATSKKMGREECIAMIGQAKFDKYTQMLGSESAAIKRCIMMRSMK